MIDSNGVFQPQAVVKRNELNYEQNALTIAWFWTGDPKRERGD